MLGGDIDGRGMRDLQRFDPKAPDGQVVHVESAEAGLLNGEAANRDIADRERAERQGPGCEGAKRESAERGRCRCVVTQ